MEVIETSSLAAASDTDNPARSRASLNLIGKCLLPFQVSLDNICSILYDIGVKNYNKILFFNIAPSNFGFCL
jgi:hypothetical protein